MDEREKMAVIESLLFISGDPVKIKDIADVLETDVREVKKLMQRAVDCFNFERRGLQIICINDSYQLASRPEYTKHIEKFIGTERNQGLSQSALETLAIVAYRQPVTKSDIDALRGVKCDYSIMNLANRGYIREVSRLDAPGRPILYGTTDLFLKSFGFSSITDLPSLDEIS